MPVNESNTIQYTVNTSRVPDGTILYWKTTGNTTNSDIVGGNTGSITITNNQAVFNVTIANDANTDGTKTLGISILTGSVNGTPVVNTSSLITIEDTSVSPAPYDIEFFLVAGGGAGGQSGGIYGGGGGGGAGGIVIGTIPSVAIGTSLSLTIGAGGSAQDSNRGLNGSNTTIAAPIVSTIVAIGGGGGTQGGPGPSYSGNPGGSGGGGLGAGGQGTATQPTGNPGNAVVTSQYGNPGGVNSPISGDGGSGGGGAGSAGGSGYPTVPSGVGGGSGYSWPKTGVTYATGGNASGVPWGGSATAGISGTANRGGGGQSGVKTTSGSGGSGVIILTIPTLQYPGSAPGATVTTPPAAPGKTVLTFNSSGTYTA